MIKTYSLFLSFIFCSFHSLHAAVGDTTKVQVHNNTHMNWYGSFDQAGVFPADSIRFSKIIMHYRLGCPTSNCSAWDYTTEITALVPTGQFDSTLTNAYYFSVNGNHPDTLFFNSDTTYITFFNATLQVTDSLPAGTSQVFIYSDTLYPFAATDSFAAWPGNYYNYLFNNLGVIIDSVWVPADSMIINTITPVYVLSEITERIELGRVITPYGGYYPNTWSHTYDFDVTDFAPVLHDTLTIRAFYSGWSDGFTVTLNFDFIEGTPPRDAIRVRNLYNGSFPYGDPGNSIENYLLPKSFSLDSNESMASIKITPTGHGYDNMECAEFCSRDYQLLVNAAQVVNQAVWRDDCGMNALYHQAGTWIYDRANWCPGDKGIARDHEITSYITPGSTVNLEMNMQPYTAVGGSPSYTIAADLFTFGPPNFLLDATIETIIAPNKNPAFIRFNPICSNPILEIKNTGSTDLTSALITYGLEGSPMSTFNWSGNLAFNQSVQVVLPGFTWTSPNSTTFKAFISQPNGGTDQYPWNDTLRSWVNFTPQYPNRFVFLLRTNSAPNETSWDLKDDAGNILYQNGTLAANTTYTDTLNLATGCYTFTLYDSDKDGLAFFANSDGNGYARFMDAYNSSIFLKSFPADFGTRISQQFTIGFTNGFEEAPAGNVFLHTYPNPGTGQVTIAMSLQSSRNVTVSVYSMTGTKIWDKNFTDFRGELINLDLSSNPGGIYLLRVVSESGTFSRRMVIEK